MRWLSLTSAALLTACGAQEFQSQKLADGSYRIQCGLSMDECIRRAQGTCQHQRYRILEGTSETRLRDAPPFEQTYHTSRLHLKCTDGDDVLLAIDKKDDVAAEEKKGEVTAPKPAKVCTTGETRSCVGAGDCKGGQACLPDGSGFGSCDCAASAAPAEAAPATAPVSVPSDAPASTSGAVAPPSGAPVAPPPAAAP
jgi:hypothetical protein